MVLGLSSDPPQRHARSINHPTLLVSWFCTGCALVVILLRVGGRYVRTERLFKEDKIMFASIIPLLIRMGLVHAILLFGTNNITTDGLSAQDVHEREIGSKLVLASRIFYAIFIWMEKWTISEFLKRLTATSWNRSYEIVLRCIRVFLALTLIGIIIAILSECRPFNHYWQVIPDPGPSCRTDYAQVLVMGISDVLTDLALIAFPIPIILNSGFATKRKISLTLLFMTSGLLIPITIVRMVLIFNSGGRQQVRSLWASIEILLAAAVANAVILGSFVRDRGPKKARNYTAEYTASVHSEKPSLHRRMTQQHWGNDSDHELFRAIGGRLSAVVLEVDQENALQGRRTSTPMLGNLDEILGEQNLNEKVSQNFETSTSGGTSSQGSSAALMAATLREERLAADMANLPLPQSRNENNAALAEFFRQGPPGAEKETTVHDFAARRPSLHIDPTLGRRGSGVSLTDAGGLLPEPERRASTVSFADEVDTIYPPSTPQHLLRHHPSTLSSSTGSAISPTTQRRQSRLPSIVDVEATARAQNTPQRGRRASNLSFADAGGLLEPLDESPVNTKAHSPPNTTLVPQSSSPLATRLDYRGAISGGRRSVSGQGGGRSVSGGSPRPTGGWSQRFNFRSPSPPPLSSRKRADSQVRRVSGPGAGQGPEEMQMDDVGGLLGVSEERRL